MLTALLSLQIYKFTNDFFGFNHVCARYCKRLYTKEMPFASPLFFYPAITSRFLRYQTVKVQKTATYIMLLKTN